MTIIRWFLSKTVREAVAMRRHVWKILQHQRDILKPESVVAVEAAITNVRTAVKSGAKRDALKAELRQLEDTANKCLRPYPHAGWRENVEVFLVAIAVAMGIRTFFLQPFKIPTGSMQPTLYGVVSAPDFGKINQVQERSLAKSELDEQVKLRNELKIPTGWDRIRDWFEGDSYLHVVAEEDGVLSRIEQPVGLGSNGGIFRAYQKYTFAGKSHTIWFPPDCGASDLAARTGVGIGRHFKRGETIFKMRIRSGDHLFVDRLTYNFRVPDRGEIIVFETKGIIFLDSMGRNQMRQDQFYIKRLVGLGGERLQIGNDRHLRINGQRLDASTPHFEFVYGFDPKAGPMESEFSGHVNQEVAASNGFNANSLFPNEQAEFKIPLREMMVMGDNTMNSSDSRYWGTFPANNVIGRSCFVYWPLSRRFGWNNLLH